MGPQHEESALYAVEFVDQAKAEADAIYLRHSRHSPDFAAHWYAGLLTQAQSLQNFPRRFAIAPAPFQVPGMATRQLLYRRGGATYRILYFLVDADGDGEEDTVRILHIYHGAQQPLGELTAEDEQE